MENRLHLPSSEKRSEIGLRRRPSEYTAKTTPHPTQHGANQAARSKIRPQFFHSNQASLQGWHHRDSAARMTRQERRRRDGAASNQLCVCWQEIPAFCGNRSFGVTFSFWRDGTRSIRRAHRGQNVRRTNTAWSSFPETSSRRDAKKASPSSTWFQRATRTILAAGHFRRVKGNMCNSPFKSTPSNRVTSALGPRN